jgi:hypothetical protein
MDWDKLLDLMCDLLDEGDSVQIVFSIYEHNRNDERSRKDFVRHLTCLHSTLDLLENELKAGGVL